MNLVESPKEFSYVWRHVPDAFDKLGGLWPLHIGHNIAKPNYTNGPRQTTYADIHFVIEGNVLLHFGHDQVLLEQGDLFCKYPNTTYSYQIGQGASSLRMAWLAFDGVQVPHVLSMAGFSVEQPFLRRRLDKEANMLLQQFLQWSLGGEKHQTMMMYSWMYRIFNKLISVRQDELTPSSTDWVQKGQDYINANFSSQITIHDVAEFVGVHRTYLARLFIKAVGMSPSSYLAKQRMERAVHYLLHTSLTITEIASSCGYPDIYTFTRAFSRYYGKSPSKYKESNAGRSPSKKAFG